MRLGAVLGWDGDVVVRAVEDGRASGAVVGGAGGDNVAPLVLRVEEEGEAAPLKTEQKRSGAGAERERRLRIALRAKV